MQATNDLRDILNAAEQAVGRDDHASAERLLRDALALQELNTRTNRDEIAKTLNNLAIVCEMLGKIADAETCYRRAYAIATASLPPTDPFVTTSRENLEEFCKANGLPIQRAHAPRPQPARPRPAAPPPQSATPPAPPAPQPRPVAAPQSPAAAQPAAGAQSVAAVRQVAAPALAAASASAAVQSASTPRHVAPRVISPGDVPLHRVPSPIAVPAKSHSSRAVVLTAVSAAVLAVALGAGRYWLASGGAAQPSAPASVSEASTTASPEAPTGPPPSSTAAATPAPAAPAPSPLIETAAPAPAPTAAPPPEPVAPLPPPPPATTASSSVSVVSAQICRSLTTSGAWQCAEAKGPQNPGTLSYFTRVASTRDTTIEHRWYHDDRLHQSVPLRIRANASGFRTYSRTTIGRERAGTWKVELRTQNGQLLDERTFDVR